jgi:hypothetical protein
MILFAGIPFFIRIFFQYIRTANKEAARMAEKLTASLFKNPFILLPCC